MPSTRASKTAEIAAAVRAAHRRYDHPVVFDDPHALQLTSPAWRTIVRSRVLHRLVVRRLLADFRSIHAEMLGRARFAEEELLRAVAGGLGQYVIIGAGLDSFALRHRELAPQLRVFELDHPASQAVKIERLAGITTEPLTHVEFIAADLEHETVAQALSRSGYDRGAPAFFAWLGNTYYLTPAAIAGTLRAIAGLAAPGSELVVDYALPVDQQPPQERGAFLKAQAAVERRGEPWRAFFTPPQFTALARECGFELVATLSPADQLERYFSGRDDGLRPPAWGHFAHLRTLRWQAVP